MRIVVNEVMVQKTLEKYPHLNERQLEYIIFNCGLKREEVQTLIETAEPCLVETLIVPDEMMETFEIDKELEIHTDETKIIYSIVTDNE